MPWPERSVEQVGVTVLNWKLAHGWTNLSSEGPGIAEIAVSVLPKDWIATAAWLLPMVSSTPSVEHHVGMAEERAGRTQRVVPAMTWPSSETMGDEELVASCGEAWLGMTSDKVGAVGVSAAVIFFKSLSIWSCLAAIRPKETLSFTKLAWMPLMVASVVTLTITSRKSNRTGFCWGKFVEGSW
jgi:small-conductance mechanosensitive channel